jgi:two-component sensor histidine kinase
MQNPQRSKPDPMISAPEGVLPPMPINEPRRLEGLRRYAILDTPEEAAYDLMTRLACRLLDAPISLVSLLDESRQWFKSRHGLNVGWTSRDISFCSYTILQDDVMVVPDALEDDRFAANPLVTKGPRIRFYAGMPLKTFDDLPLGTLCVLDTEPKHDFDEDKKESLRDLAALIMHEIEASYAAKTAAFEIEERRKAEQSLASALEEKEILLREIHHRVKNNLQSLWGLLQIEKSRMTDAHARTRIDAVSQRINVMGSIHRQLYSSQNLARIDLGLHLEELCEHLNSLYGFPHGVNVTVEAGAVECSLDTAIPLGLIANEAISNSLKHAFPSGRTGRILVRLHWIADETSDRTTELLITDDGVGLQGAVGHSPGGIGMTLIEALADQIDASVTVKNEAGYTLSIRFGGCNRGSAQ